MIVVFARLRYTYARIFGVWYGQYVIFVWTVCNLMHSTVCWTCSPLDFENKALCMSPGKAAAINLLQCTQTGCRYGLGGNLHRIHITAYLNMISIDYWRIKMFKYVRWAWNVRRSLVLICMCTKIIKYNYKIWYKIWTLYYIILEKWLCVAR